MMSCSYDSTDRLRQKMKDDVYDHERSERMELLIRKGGASGEGCGRQKQPSGWWILLHRLAD